MPWNILDDTSAILGEGVFWHPKRETVFWFDILGQKLFEIRDNGRQSWSFPRSVSAAGWVDKNRLLIADSASLFLFDLSTGSHRIVVDLEADNSLTRSNDGRADRHGGFWIGTMGLKAELGAGSIYRYYKGELRRLFSEITIPNAICFSPNGQTVYFADSHERLVWKQALDGDGWPTSERQVFLDFTSEPFAPDGAVIDAVGRFWNAQWGASRVACYNPDGTLVAVYLFPATQISCPSFYGNNLTKLAVTSAREGLTEAEMALQPLAGQLFSTDTNEKGLLEPRVWFP